jgi:hypothetical protein
MKVRAGAVSGGYDAAVCGSWWDGRVSACERFGNRRRNVF